MIWPFKERPRTLRDVRRLRLDPGDALVVFFDHHPSQHQVEFVRGELRQQFPDNRVLVASAGIDFAVIARKERIDG